MSRLNADTYAVYISNLEDPWILVSKEVLETMLQGYQGLRGDCSWKPDGTLCFSHWSREEFQPRELLTEPT